MKLQIINIDTPTLGDRSYLIHDGKVALVIDPQRDIDRVEKLLTANGLVLGAVAETHMHNDYITGGLQLARNSSAPYVVNIDEKVLFEAFRIKDKQILQIGSFAIRAIHTPGHTFNHLSYQLIDSSEQVVGIFTGGSLLHGSTGRPDLLGIKHARELATLQYLSAQEVSQTLSDSVQIYPTHGFGSFCSATPTTDGSSTIGDERKVNPVLLSTESEYVSNTLKKLDAYPTYFKHMAHINEEGPSSTTFDALSEITLEEVEQSLATSGRVIDVRERKSWCQGHLEGSISLGVEGSLASYAGWLFRFDEPLILLSDKDEDLLVAQRELFRIGITNIKVAKVDFANNANNVSTRSVQFAELGKSDALAITLLDVRQNLERQSSYVQGSIHIPLHELENRIDEIPSTKPIWVHCGSGYRAAAALGLLERAGLVGTLVNDSFESASKIDGIKVISE